MGILDKLIVYLRMIKFSHSIFALPFALTGALLAASGIPSAHQILWIIIAMVGARSGAMGMNRIIDRRIDADNPRTEEREIPSGKVTLRDALTFSVISFAVLVFAAYQLNPLCLALSPVAIIIITFYSYTKRFTWLSHFALGIALSGAPLGAWIAVRGIVEAAILPLCGAVVFWLAGFDTLYALQDVEFDRGYGLKSIPQRFGVRSALIFSRLFHFITCSLLVLTGILFHMAFPYWIGMAVIVGLVVYEHSLVKPDDLRKLDKAFFEMNGYISVAVFVSTLVALVL